MHLANTLTSGPSPTRKLTFFIKGVSPSSFAFNLLTYNYERTGPGGPVSTRRGRGFTTNRCSRIEKTSFDDLLKSRLTADSFLTYKSAIKRHCEWNSETLCNIRQIKNNWTIHEKTIPHSYSRLLRPPTT
jgi:hypothetical protein